MHRKQMMDTGAQAAGLQAQVWFARLRAHDCQPEERAAFERWRAADATHDVAYADLEEVWALSAELAREDPDIAAAVRQARHEDSRPWLARRWPLLATAAMLVLAGAWVGLVKVREVPVQRYATATGEQRRLVLEDGSIVVLDTASALEVRYGRRQRDLALRQGRADFQVHRDTGRPFVVHAGKARVTATGTQFQVRVQGLAGAVTLLEGRVAVASAASARDTVMSPGDRITLGADGELGAVTRLSAEERANAEGWTIGQLVVKAWPIEALVAEVNRYGGTPLRLGDAAVGRLPVSGTFDPKAPESLALALSYGWPVRVERGDGEIVLYAK